MATRQPVIWILWLVSISGLTASLVVILYSNDRSIFLIGATTHGHHQIELACGACHTSPFGGTEVLQEACVSCHGKELADANDSHPRTKFTDPRNADRTAILDARVCVTCHREHRPEITVAMGLTLPDDYCFKCHENIGTERPTHKDAAFDSCASSGCHNFHDNRALYEDFLMAHLHEPKTLAAPAVPRPSWAFPGTAPSDRIKPALDRAAVAAVAAARTDDEKLLHDWESTLHAKAGVGCVDCHETKSDSAAQAVWNDHPDRAACGQCHAPELKGFLGGKHGMRLADGLDIPLSPMTPAMARIPMKPEAAHKELGCTSCHGAHGFDTKAAAVESCLGCHADEHTLAYKQSPHFELWQRELAGTAPVGSGVSCATCHMPREIHKGPVGDVVRTQHNQNDNLRPNDKMVRSVCMSCHGLNFSLDALADRALIQQNFAADPSVHVESLDWAEKRPRRGVKK